MVAWVLYSCDDLRRDGRSLGPFTLVVTQVGIEPAGGADGPMPHVYVVEAFLKAPSSPEVRRLLQDYLPVVDAEIDQTPHGFSVRSADAEYQLTLGPPVSPEDPPDGGTPWMWHHLWHGEERVAMEFQDSGAGGGNRVGAVVGHGAFDPILPDDGSALDVVTEVGSPRWEVRLWRLCVEEPRLC